jgi:hypothetical protein
MTNMTNAYEAEYTSPKGKYTCFRVERRDDAMWVAKCCGQVGNWKKIAVPTYLEAAKGYCEPVNDGVLRLVWSPVA